MSDQRLRVVERVDGRLHLRFDKRVEPGTPLSFGRGGDVSIGVEPLDTKVSRHAVVITAAPRGWIITPTNRSGVILHLWGLAPYPIQQPASVGWHRIGVRVVGDPGIEHWILLEDSEDHTVAAASGTTGLTERNVPPRPLTPDQLEAVGVVFFPLLTWPPTVDAQVRQLKQVAARTNRSPAAIQKRLEAVRRKASKLGLSRVPELTDPEYLYILVRAGYVMPRPENVDPLLGSG